MSRILSLDISGSTGWAFLDTSIGASSLEHGSFCISKPAKSFAEHPWGYYEAARLMGRLLYERFMSKYNTASGEPGLDVLVVEETNGARARFTQKFLEYCHFAFLEKYMEAFEGEHAAPKLIYLNTSEWRSITNTRLTKEEKNQNARLGRHKRKAAGAGKKLDKKALGIAGKITIKHVAIRRVKELYGIDLLAKQDDEADAILLVHAYINGAKPCTGNEER